MLRPFLIALQFLTRIPLPRLSEPSPQDLGRSLLAYPAVGFLLGVMLIVIDQLFVTAAAPLRAALALVFWTLITGMLHLDGLADSADAWLGGHGDRERSLSIMQDPTSGPAGVTLIVLVLITKFAALGTLAQSGPTSGLLLAPLLARTALIALFLTLPYKRAGGLGSALAAHLPQHYARVTLIGVALAVTLFGGWPGLLALLATALTFVALRSLMLRRLGGTTGDTAGAMVEIVEAVVLVAVAIG